MSDYRVLSVPTNTTAVVSTIGLVRVVTDDGRVISELVEPWEAEVTVETYNDLHRTSRARIVPYRVQQSFRPRLVTAGGEA